MPRQAIEIKSDFKIIVRPMPQPDLDWTNHVDRVWNDACKDNPRLFDGQTLAVQSASASQLVCGVVPYRFFYVAQKTQMGTRESMMLAAVSGITIWDSRVLFGQRGLSVTQYAGAFELVPSGSLPAGNEGAEIDFRAHLLEELEEETHISSGGVLSCEPTLLVVDEDDCVTDVCCVIQLRELPDLAGCRESGEYASLNLESVESVKNLMGANASSWVPTSRELIGWLTKNTLVTEL